MHRILKLSVIKKGLEDRRLYQVAAKAHISYTVLKRICETNNDNFSITVLQRASDYLLNMSIFKPSNQERLDHYIDLDLILDRIIEGLEPLDLSVFAQQCDVSYTTLKSIVKNRSKSFKLNTLKIIYQHLELENHQYIF